MYAPPAGVKNFDHNVPALGVGFGDERPHLVRFSQVPQGLCHCLARVLLRGVARASEPEQDSRLVLSLHAHPPYAINSMAALADMG
jgi:hypothetical protein